MKRYGLILLSLVLVTAGLIWGVASRAPAPTTIPPSPVRTSPGKTNEPVTLATVPRADAASPHTTAATEESSPSLPLISDAENAKTRVRQLSATFDEAHVAELARYLNHPSADVRGAATEGLVLIGDSSAVPMIRAAAELAEKDPAKSAEAVALWDAAKVLSDAHKSGEPRMPKLPLNTNPETEVRNPLETVATASKQ